MASDEKISMEASPARIDAAVSRAKIFIAGRKLLKDTIAGIVAAIVLTANIISFGALMFPGELSAGIPVSIWAMLIGSAVGGIWIAIATSLPPLASGIDSPTGIVLVLLSAAIGSNALLAGETPQAAVQAVMLAFSAATVISGALFYGLGALRLGSYFRFVPYFVVCGFLAATGWFLISGGLRMTTGRSLTLDSLGLHWSAGDVAKLASAVAALLVLLAVRRWLKSAFAMPAALILMWISGALALESQNLMAAGQGWYFPSLGALGAWSPLAALKTAHIHISIAYLPDLLAVAVVALISLITKVSSIEVARQASGDLDRELRAHGLGSLAAAPLGGLTCSLQTGTSRLLEHAGGATRMSGVICALVLGIVGLASFDLLAIIPVPLIAGLVFYLGYTFLVDALWRPYAQRAWLDLALAIGIMAVCVRFGYLVGVLAGVVCACLMFAISYARVGVVRRHLTRPQFSSYVDRPADASGHLREAGDSIQIYWLSGYIFFGSSEAILERVRRDIEALPPHRVSHVILDFGMVSGADSSAGASLAKLRHFCAQQGVTLVYCALSAANLAALKRGGFAATAGQIFADVNLALAWCEERLLANAGIAPAADSAGFEQWLQQQLGDRVKASDLIAFLKRRETADSDILYRQGDPADTIDLIASGQLAVDVARGAAEPLRVRRMTTHTVLGEMGFFRKAARSATVSSDGPATLMTLSRANFERMRAERPDLASAFDDFIIRILADRIDFANRGVAALSRQRQ